MRVVGVIPARYASSRLPGKPLAEIDGLPMVIHTMKRAEMAGLDEVVVATDHNSIFDMVKVHGGTAIMTSGTHPSGTDRVAEVAREYPKDTLIVNIQGDEPLLRPEHINISIGAVESGYQTACPCARFDAPHDFTAIKVVRNLKNEVMFFSRSAIPSDARVNGATEYFRQVCIYTFTQPFLEMFAGWEQTPLERIEMVEELRILEHGYPIAAPLVEDYQFSIDTPAELERVRQVMPGDKYRRMY